MKRRGFTLVEVLIALAVAAVLLTATLQLLVMAFHLFARGSTRTDLQSAGFIALGKMSRELEGASMTTLTLSGDPNNPQVGFAFRPPQEGAAYVVYGFDATQGVVVRRLAPPLIPPRRLTMAELMTDLSTPTPQDAVVARNVQAMTLGVSSGGPGALPIAATYPPPDGVIVANPVIAMGLTIARDGVAVTVTTSVMARN